MSACLSDKTDLFQASELDLPSAHCLASLTAIASCPKTLEELCEPLDVYACSSSAVLPHV